MWLDAWLAVRSARLRAGTYAQQVQVDDKGVNQRLQELSSGKMLFSLRRIALIIIAFAGCYYIAEMAYRPELLAFLMGFIFGMYAIILGRHLFNILFFRYLNRHPEAMEGSLRYSSAATHFIGGLDLVRTLPIVVLVVLWMPGPSTYGIAFGFVVLWLLHQRGLKRKVA